jgi:hypothetical protein
VTVGLLSLVFLTTILHAQVTPQNVWTWHNDNYRTGWQPGENLSPNPNSSYYVSQNTFGLLWQWGTPGNPLAGAVWAEPLAVSVNNVSGCSTSPCNLILVATEQDMLYGFDSAPGVQRGSKCPACNPVVWSLDLAGAVGGTYVSCGSAPGSSWSLCTANSGGGIIGPYLGVTGTPVIDMSASPPTLYVAEAAVVPPGTSGTIGYYLLAVNILTGQVLGQPIQITGSVPGSSTPPSTCGVGGAGNLAFNNSHIQRSGLLLLNGNVYVAFADLPETENGWLFGYSFDGSAFTRTVEFSTTPSGTGGGIWGSGAGPASDGTYIYLATGNGTLYDPTASGPPVDAGDTLLKLGPVPNSSLGVVDWYTPYDAVNYSGTTSDGKKCTGLCECDMDVSSGGVLLVPSPFTFTNTCTGNNCSSQCTTSACSVVINADKQSNIYVANQASLGGFVAGNNQNGQNACPSTPNNIECIQTPPNNGNTSQGYWGSPAYWSYIDSSGVPHYMLYYAPTVQDDPTASPLAINGYSLATQGPSGPVPTTYLSTPVLFCPRSPTPSVSSTGTQAGTGIVWAIEHQNSNNPGGSGPNCNGNVNGQYAAAVLHAFDATNLASPTPLYTSRNVQTTIGTFTKFVPPTIFNGQVYMATQTEVDVFGLCSTNVNNGNKCLN